MGWLTYIRPVCILSCCTPVNRCLLHTLPGAACVVFSSHASYIAAVSARFMQLSHGSLDKKVKRAGLEGGCVDNHTSFMSTLSHANLLSTAVAVNTFGEGKGGERLQWQVLTCKTLSPLVGRGGIGSTLPFPLSTTVCPHIACTYSSSAHLNHYRINLKEDPWAPLSALYI